MGSPTRMLRRLLRQVRRHDWRCLMAYSALIIPSAAVFLYLLLAYYLAGDPRLVPHTIQQARNVLLVTAHPDDETLFFSPTILHGRNNPDVTRSLLVLSTGESSLHLEFPRSEFSNVMQATIMAKEISAKGRSNAVARLSASPPIAVSSSSMVHYRITQRSGGARMSSRI